jgi:hypothetical protein
MGERGTEVATYDYADFAERILGCRVLILYDDSAAANFDGCVRKFVCRFGERVHACTGGGTAPAWRQAAALVKAERVTHVHCFLIDFLPHEVPRWPGVRRCVHSVFDARAALGDAFARISPCVPGGAPVVAHIVRPWDEEVRLVALIHSCVASCCRRVHALSRAAGGRGAARRQRAALRARRPARRDRLRPARRTEYHRTT